MPNPPEAILDHVAIAVPKASEATPFLVGCLGGRPNEAGPGPGYRFWQWAFARGERIEILEPDGPPGGFVQRFLDSRGPGVHHVTFKVPDLGAATARAAAQSYDVVGYNDSSPFWKEAFLHPKQAQGIVVQLAESHLELEPEGMPRPPFPAAPPPATPARIMRLQLSARSAQRARHQWQETLLGEARESGDDLLFRWPDSPLEIAVHVDPAAGEGPLAIGLADVDGGQSGGQIPSGPHPTLGAAFVIDP